MGSPPIPNLENAAIPTLQQILALYNTGRHVISDSEHLQHTMSLWIGIMLEHVARTAVLSADGTVVASDVDHLRFFTIHSIPRISAAGHE
jgi:hypothetical protein